ncbi:MAG: EthD domain-containing protein [Proteobacteria bacterium]|nr:EthD domain-containing protein [Pseudomonadota bacterium]
MLKVMTLFVKRPDMTRRQFRDYYEGNHVAMGLAANKHFGFSKYVRNHTVATLASPPAQALREFDCFSEYSFPDVDQAVKAQAYMLTPGGKALAEDELNFLDMSYHPSFGVTETLIAGAPRGVEPGLTGKVALVLARGEGSDAASFQAAVQRFSQEYAQAHRGAFVRMVLDSAVETPAGRPAVDAVLSLWTPPGRPGAPEDFRWPGKGDAAIVVEIECIEAATEVLGL